MEVGRRAENKIVPCNNKKAKNCPYVVETEKVCFLTGHYYFFEYITGLHAIHTVWSIMISEG